MNKIRKIILRVLLMLVKITRVNARIIVRCECSNWSFKDIHATAKLFTYICPGHCSDIIIKHSTNLKVT